MNPDLMPFVKKYAPKNPKDIIGQEEAVKAVSDFVANFKKKRKKAVIVFGPAGCGKTSMVYAIASETGAEVIEANASDFRNEEQINLVLGNAIKQQSLFGKGKIILVDEIDGLSGMKDRGGVSALALLAEKTSFPIIMTANDPFDKKFAPLRKIAEMVEMRQLSNNDAYEALKKICKSEKISFDEPSLKDFARRSGGDLRGAINDLQMLSSAKKQLTKEELNDLPDREREESIINAIMRVLKTTDPVVAISAYDNIPDDYDQVMLWLDENIPKEYEKPADLARAYDFLSKADIMKRRIRRWQHWRFLVYINAYLSAGVAVSKDEKYSKFVKYGPTTRILKLWKANMVYAKRKSIAEKVAEHTHCSSSTAIQDAVPYLKVIFRKNREMANKIAEELELSEEEAEWLRR